MPSLSRAEAQQRARTVAVENTEIELDLTSADSFRCRTRIEFRALQPGESTFLDCRACEVHAVSYNGLTLPPTAWRDGRIELEGLAERNVVEVDATMDYSHDAEGLHQHIDPADGQRYLYAMSFLDAAPTWFACFDQPDLKSRYTLRVTVPDGWDVVGNGEATHTGSTWTVEVPHPISTYLVTLVAGPYVSVTGQAGDVALALYARKSLAPELHRHADDLLGVTRDAFAEYTRRFDAPYAFGAYRQVFVPDFNAGAMENPGCVLLRDSLLFRGAATSAELGARAGIVVHELAHMWFGDLVTMRWWDELWLNEAFAEYLSQRVTTDATRYPRWTAFGAVRKPRGIAADQLPSSHPVAQNRADTAAEALSHFDAISYTKGAALVRQLQVRMGDDVFWAGLNAYLDAYAFGNATLSNLLAAWTEAGADGLPQWSDAWLTTRGVDLLRADAAEVERLNPRGQEAPREHAICVVALDALGHETGRTNLVVGSLPRAHDLRGACLVPDADDASWATVRPSVAWRDVPTISAVAAEAIRVVLYNGLRDAVAHGEIGAVDAWTCLVRALPTEDSDEILAAQLAWAEELIGVWAPVASRVALTAHLADLARGLLLDADPGSDRQLVAWRALIGATDDVEELQGWLAGERIPTDAALDRPLRWACVVRLATLGTDVVAAELERDGSAAGHRAAAEARASLPTLAAKRAALDELVTGEVDPDTLTALGAGLYRGLGAADLASVAAAWCDRVEQLCARRRGWALQRALRASVPLPAADDEIARRMDELQQLVSLPATARKEIADAADEITRAAHSQQRFGALQ